jgi:hypothetical protein
VVQEWKGCIYAVFKDVSQSNCVGVFEKNTCEKQEKNKLKVRDIHFDEAINILDGYKMNYI